MSALLLLVTVALCMFVVVAAMLLTINWTAEWWYARGPGGRKPDEPAIKVAAAPKAFTCTACGSGPWDLAWDPHEQPVMGRRGGRICPNCSGAD